VRREEVRRWRTRPSARQRQIKGYRGGHMGGGPQARPSISAVETWESGLDGGVRWRWTVEPDGI
jgi:hypothetical protein